MKRLLTIAVLTVGALGLLAQPTLQDTFSYPDGALTNVAAGIWNWHSGSGGLLTLNVVNGRAFVNQPSGSSGGDDYNRSLGASFDPNTDQTSKLYAGFTVNFSALPFNGGTSTAGSYFAHLKSSTESSGFYARVGANQEGAAPDTFRLALSNKGWSTTAATEFPLDLTLNTDYKVIIRLDLATDQSTMWINPVDENSTSVTATDTFTYAANTIIDQFALRQGTTGTSPNIGAPGSLYLDDLRFGTTFQEAVIPEPNGLLALGGLILLGWNRFRRQG